MRNILLLLTCTLCSSGIAQDYSEVDNYARNTPKVAEKTVESLAAYLSKVGDNDSVKVRAFYVWLTDNIAYDTKTFFSNNPNPKTSASDALHRKKAICQGYAELFKELCNESHMECFIVTGYGKGYGYDPKTKFNDSNHAWNAVKVNNKWELIDATWGAGYLKGQKYEQRFTEDYFFTVPSKMVEDHLPVDPMWQLLPCPISLSEYKLPKEDLLKLTQSKSSCFSFNDTIAAYQQMNAIDQQVNTAERAMRFNPNNYTIAGYAYLNLGYELSLTLPPLYEKEQYEDALVLNKHILAYNKKAYAYLKKSDSDQAQNAAEICKHNIAQMEENIKGLEDFID